jgi:hypothetical protein
LYHIRATRWLCPSPPAVRRGTPLRAHGGNRGPLKAAG